MVNSKYTKQDLVTAEESHLTSSNIHNHEVQTFTQQHEPNDLLSEDESEEEAANPDYNKNDSLHHQSEATTNSMTIMSEAALAGDTFNTRIKMPFKSKIAQNVMQTTIATLGLILFYFALSIGLTFYQRWLLNVSVI